MQQRMHKPRGEAIFFSYLGKGFIIMLGFILIKVIVSYKIQRDQFTFHDTR